MLRAHTEITRNANTFQVRSDVRTTVSDRDDMSNVERVVIDRAVAHEARAFEPLESELGFPERATHGRGDLDARFSRFLRMEYVRKIQRIHGVLE